MKDFPDDLVGSMATSPMQTFLGPWKVTLKSYILNPFMGTYPFCMFLYR